jgi:predicted transcriptional regulator
MTIGHFAIWNEFATDDVSAQRLRMIHSTPRRIYFAFWLEHLAEARKVHLFLARIVLLQFTSSHDSGLTFSLNHFNIYFVRCARRFRPHPEF